MNGLNSMGGLTHFVLDNSLVENPKKLAHFSLLVQNLNRLKCLIAQCLHASAQPNDIAVKSSVPQNDAYYPSQNTAISLSFGLFLWSPWLVTKEKHKAKQMAESSSSSSSPVVKSDAETEELLDRMLTRLALCDDSKLETLLSKIIPLTISSLSSNSTAVRNKAKTLNLYSLAFNFSLYFFFGDSGYFNLISC